MGLQIGSGDQTRASHFVEEKKKGGVCVCVGGGGRRKMGGVCVCVCVGGWVCAVVAVLGVVVVVVGVLGAKQFQ